MSLQVLHFGILYYIYKRKILKNINILYFSFFFFFSIACRLFFFSQPKGARKETPQRTYISAYLRVGWLGQRKQVSVTCELERNVCIRNNGSGSWTRIDSWILVSKTRTVRRHRVAFHVIERRARLGRRVTRSTTRLLLPTRARNVSGRAFGWIEILLFYVYEAQWHFLKVGPLYISIYERYNIVSLLQFDWF